MKWEKKLKEWNSGNYQKYPKNKKKRFFYETSVITSLDDKYQHIYIESDKLEKLKMNYSTFSQYIKNTKNNYATSFYNLSKTSLLIIPIPRKNKDYTTIKDFMENASDTQQSYFWKYATKYIKFMLKKYGKIYVSTHGLGVPYFHLRIDLEPKYYITSKFK